VLGRVRLLLVPPATGRCRPVPHTQWDRVGADAIVVFLDNRYVEGSNHPVTRTDAEGNTYQRRRLADGSEWEVLKNFPSEDELRLALEPHALAITLSEWRYYWGAVCLGSDLL
jgi:hypothetical protein